MEKKVAEELREILHNPIVEVVLDRSQPIKPAIEDTLKLWQADLAAGQVARAYTQGLDGRPIYKGNEPDIFPVLMALAQRKSVINIPSYDEYTPVMLTLGQRIASKENRHGQITRVVSRENAHSFNARMFDYNVITTKPDGTEEVGAYRNFMVVNYFGTWHQGWSNLGVKLTEEEMKSFEEQNLTVGTGVIRQELVSKGVIRTYEEKIASFRNFVHPEVAMLFYHPEYIKAKALVNRLRDEARFCRELEEKLRKMNIKLPAPEEIEERIVSEPAGPRERLVVPNLEAKLILPKSKGQEPKGRYPVRYPIYSIEGEDVKRYDTLPTSDYKAMQGVLRYAMRQNNDLTYRIGASIRSVVRAVELAYFLHGFEGGKGSGREVTPLWEVPQWVRDYREPRGRTMWNALHLAEDPDVLLLYRIRATPLQVRPQERITRTEESKMVLI